MERSGWEAEENQVIPQQRGEGDESNPNHRSEPGRAAEK